MKKFNKDAKSDKGAIMFCVCKGKLSEGIDFKDKLCRSVMFIGVPFLPPEGTDVKLDYKQKYL
jgi:Rad3-related DNA helicase